MQKVFVYIKIIKKSRDATLNYFCFCSIFIAQNFAVF